MAIGGAGMGGKLFDLRIDVVDDTGCPWSDARVVKVVVSGFEAVSKLVVVFL